MSTVTRYSGVLPTDLNEAREILGNLLIQLLILVFFNVLFLSLFFSTRSSMTSLIVHFFQPLSMQALITNASLY